MKVNNNTLEYMQKDIKTFITFAGVDPKELNVNDLNNIWFHTYANRTYPDDHPMVKKDNNGVRILSYIDRDNYDLYPCDTNDTTIYTALNKILKNLQNE